MAEDNIISFPEFWNEDDDDIFNEVSEENKKYLNLFVAYLKDQKLSNKTIGKHLENVQFYTSEYLNYYGEAESIKVGCYRIDSFLGDWYIEKCMWASKSDCKSNAASIKKFYKCLLENDIVSKEDYNFLCQDIKENQQDWFDTIERYDNMLEEDEWF